MNTKDKQGLYLNGKLKSDNYTDAIKELYQLDRIPSGFCANADHDAAGYSVIDSNGVQHIYDLSPVNFYENLMKME